MLRDEGHSLTGFWFNPNIHPYDEYELRLESVRKFANLVSTDMLYSEYKSENYLKMFKDFKTKPQMPERCRMCYALRLEKTAEEASARGFDAFSTTLLISPYQNFEQIAAAGKEAEERYKVLFYLRDFRLYFRESWEYGKKFGFYRQKYCGCIFSREERLNQIQNLKKKNESPRSPDISGRGIQKLKTTLSFRT
jgi:predicted adenine nucleotide alpha hydrolase (AANH) superfamily ATPase